MTRPLALALAVVPGAAAWALCGTVGFEALVALGALSLLGGIWSLAQPLRRGTRDGVVAFAFLALLGPTGLRMHSVAGSFRPFSSGSAVSAPDFDDLRLPVASEGEWALDKQPVSRVYVTVTRSSQLVWKGKSITLDEWDRILESRTRQPLIRCHHDIPFQHLGWVAAIAAAHGHRTVLLGVERFARFPADAQQVLAEVSHEYWPELELEFPVVRAEGPRVRVIATTWQERIWPPLTPYQADVPRRMEQVAAGARYELEGRATEDLSELAEWMREMRPAMIEPDPAVPLRFVVAVQNEIRKAGHPPASLVLPALPGDDVLKAEWRPYPAGG